MARLGTGLETDSTDNKFYPYYSTTSGATYDKSMEFKSNTWYRAVMTVDLDSRAGTGSIYEIGNNPASINWTPTDATTVGEPCYTRTGLRFRPTASGGISAICLNTYGNPVHLPNDPEDPGLALYDNLKVWQDPRGASIIIR